MQRRVEGVSMAESRVAGAVVGFVLATLAWMLGWVFSQCLSLVRRVR